jgi:DNA-binding GntR family transcriptional regulator
MSSKRWSQLADAIDFLSAAALACAVGPSARPWSWQTEAARLRRYVREDNKTHCREINAREHLLLADELERGDRQALAARLRRIYADLQTRVLEFADEIERGVPA